MGTAAVQVPAPLQKRAGDNSEVLAQLAAAHCVLLSGYVHALRLPDAQLPPQVPSPAQAAREPCGSPLVTAEHVPTAMATSQASHCPVQALLQQNPSTQWLFSHCPLLVHALPSGRAAVQLPSTQYGAATPQSALRVQLSKQAVPPPLQARLPGHAALLTLGQ